MTGVVGTGGEWLSSAVDSSKTGFTASSIPVVQTTNQSKFNSVATILHFLVSIDFDSIFEKYRNVGFFVTNVYDFLSLHNITIPEVLSAFVNKNNSCDNGSK